MNAERNRETKLQNIIRSCVSGAVMVTDQLITDASLAGLKGLKLSFQPQVRTGNYEADVTLLLQRTAIKQANKVYALCTVNLSKSRMILFIEK